MAAAGLDQVLTFYFRPQGRISRTEFALGTVLIWLISTLLLLFLVRTGETAPFLVLPFFLVGLPLTIGLAMLVVKRSHDIGLPGSFVLLLFVPVVGIVWLAALMFIPGNPAPNLYGPPPQFRSD